MTGADDLFLMMVMLAVIFGVFTVLAAVAEIIEHFTREED